MNDSSSTQTDTCCARHPKVETALTCASCGTPICPKCMVVTPVGMKCPDCGSQRGGALFQINPLRLLLAGLVSLGAGVVAALISGIGFFFIIFISMAYGYFAGGVILKAAGMKRGLKLEIVAGAGMIIGGFAFRILNFGDMTSAVSVLRSFVDPWFLIGLGIATSCAVSKIRYL